MFIHLCIAILDYGRERAGEESAGIVTVKGSGYNT